MSATIGTFAAFTICGMAAVDSASGQLTRTMSAPAASSACTCAMVAAASAVSVLVIDCTVIGALPPTGTEPTRICRHLRRWISRYGRTLISSLLIATAAPHLAYAASPWSRDLSVRGGRAAHQAAGIHD